MYSGQRYVCYVILLRITSHNINTLNSSTFHQSGKCNLVRRLIKYVHAQFSFETNAENPQVMCLIYGWFLVWFRFRWLVINRERLWSVSKELLPQSMPWLYQLLYARPTLGSFSAGRKLICAVNSVLWHRLIESHSPSWHRRRKSKSGLGGGRAACPRFDFIIVAMLSLYSGHTTAPGRPGRRWLNGVTSRRTGRSTGSSTSGPPATRRPVHVTSGFLVSTFKLRWEASGLIKIPPEWCRSITLRAVSSKPSSELCWYDDRILCFVNISPGLTIIQN